MAERIAVRGLEASRHSVNSVAPSSGHRRCDEEGSRDTLDGCAPRLPAQLLAHILLSASDQESLMRHVAVCTQVHPEWWRAVSSTPAYGMAMLEDPKMSSGRRPAKTHDRADHRANVLANICQKLDGLRLGAGNRTLNVSARVGQFNRTPSSRRPAGRERPVPFLCVEAAAVLAACLRALHAERQPSRINLSYQPVGDAGIEVLAAALPPELRGLSVDCTSLGDAGMEKRSWLSAAGTTTGATVGASARWGGLRWVASFRSCRCWSGSLLRSVKWTTEAWLRLRLASRAPHR